MREDAKAFELHPIHTLIEKDSTLTPDDLGRIEWSLFELADQRAILLRAVETVVRMAAAFHHAGRTEDARALVLATLRVHHVLGPEMPALSQDTSRQLEKIVGASTRHLLTQEAVPPGAISTRALLADRREPLRREPGRRRR